MIKYEHESLSIAFDPLCGGFPSLINYAGNNIIESKTPWINCVLDSKKKAYPFLPENFKTIEYDFENAHRMEFQKIPWRDEAGNVLDDFYLSLRYEFWPDGTAFVNSFFLVENTQAPDICDFKLEISLNLSNAEDLRWGFLPRPKAHDGTAIQSANPMRFLGNRKRRTTKKQILPQISFDYSQKNKTARHLEFFMEGQNTLSGSKTDVATDICWNNKSPELCWNFQTENASCHERPWQWRNQFGWLVTAAPVKRNLSPLRMYHYLDNYKRYPSNVQLDKMADSGADALIIHENWRLDAQNGGIPYCSKDFKRVVKHAHEHDIRVAVYVRGNEPSVAEEYCDWFDTLLQKNFDGLYMDYGSPLLELSPADESYHSGRIHFRKHYIKMKKVREQVGKDGLLFSHTGPWFSALGMTGGIIDGYVSGEGERGVMIKDRRCHEYFSAANVVHGTMWTAAFPEYGTSQMIPFMAASGQSSHAPLGVQFANSSLAHPGIPGINDLYLRPLWKLWGIFKGEKEVNFYTEFNCKNIFNENDPDTGKYLMISKDRQTALLIVSNFGNTKRLTETYINWKNTDFHLDRQSECFLLKPDSQSPGKPQIYADYLNEFRVELDAYGVAGWLFSNQPEKLLSQLNKFQTPYPSGNESISQYKKYINEQKTLRNMPPCFKDSYLCVDVENLAIPYEESMWWDLYENALQLGEFDDDLNFKPIAWISQKGLVKRKPLREDYIWPGHQSTWIKLDDCLSKGIHKLGIRSLHSGKPFYSFIKVILSPEPEENIPEAYAITFLNELEPDRSYLRFNINIKKY